MRTRSSLRFVSPFVHGALDYLLIGALVMAPALFPAGTPRAAALACYGVGVAHWLLSSLTRYPFGVVRVVPFPVHGAIELLTAPLLIALPWLVGFADVPVARTVFVVAGAALLAVFLTTDYARAERERGVPEPPIDRGAQPPRQDA